MKRPTQAELGWGTLQLFYAAPFIFFLGDFASFLG